jgi:flagellar protein FliJ
MPKFVYRLQKVFELRERRKKEQEQRVIEAQKHLKAMELLFEEKKTEIRLVSESMRNSPHIMMAAHDTFIYHLNGDLKIIAVRVSAATRKLRQARELLQKLQAELEALIKHKEKAIEEWKEDEKRQELKMLDEVAGQRYFRAQQAALLELEHDNLEYDNMDD